MLNNTLPIMGVGALIALSTTTLEAQATPKSSAATGPSLAETANWISTDFVSLARYSDNTEDTNGRYRSQTSTWRTVDQARLSSCRLVLTQTTEIDVGGTRGRIGAVQTIPLADVDVNGFEVREAYLATGKSRKQPAYVLVVRTRKEAGETIRTSINAGAEQSAAILEIPAASREAGERMTNALRHAARLCGAKTSIF